MESYVRSLVESLAEVEHHCGRGLGITVRLLLSINRTSSLSVADDIITLAEKYAREVIKRPPVPPVPCGECAARASGSEKFASDSGPIDLPRSYGPYVVGVELSGDPTRGDATAFLPLLSRARAAGLRVSVHCGEVMNVKETEAVLNFAPHRLGHMCVLSHTSVSRMLALPREQRIPIEVCPTSNALTLHLPSLHHHPTLSPWLQAGYPLAVCTDDSGVFHVSLSDELADVAATYGLTSEAVGGLALQAFDYAFVDQQTKARLKAQAKARIDALLAALPAADVVLPPSGLL